jgi:hypothetical protein
MVSYVLLITIAVALSTMVFVWLRSYATIEPPINCDEGTSLILQNYNCSSEEIILEVKNNGRFNVDGFILVVGENENRAPTTYLTPSSESLERTSGHYTFREVLKPGNTGSGRFERGQIEFNTIRVVQIQPFVIKDGERIICSDAVIRQEISNCVLV